MRVHFLIYLSFFSSVLFAQNKVEHPIWRLGVVQSFQKFDPFTSVQIQYDWKRQQLSCSMGFSAQKASQHIFHPALSVAYSRYWNKKSWNIGPLLNAGIDSYVFGTRWLYLHASFGYRLSYGEKWRVFQESSFGPTTESFTYQETKNRSFTWNYQLKIGIQYALP